MKKTLVIAGIAGLLMLGVRAEALTLTPTGTTCTNTSNLNLGEIYDLLNGCFGVTIPEEDFQNLYKSEGSAEEGLFASSYNTTFAPSTATIRDVATPTISCPECYLVVKAGQTRYYYDISSWNGTDDIVLSGWTSPNYSAISNVAIYGVPEPATILLLVTGLGLLVLRKRQQLA